MRRKIYGMENGKLSDLPILKALCLADRALRFFISENRSHPFSKSRFCVLFVKSLDLYFLLIYGIVVIDWENILRLVCKIFFTDKSQIVVNMMFVCF